jgi:hypothetical protein
MTLLRVLNLEPLSFGFKHTSEKFYTYAESAKLIFADTFHKLFTMALSPIIIQDPRYADSVQKHQGPYASNQRRHL